MKNYYSFLIIVFVFFTIYTYSQDTIINYPTNGALYSVYIENDTVWYCSSGGIVILDTNGNWIRNITENDGLLHNSVNCNAKDSIGNMWFGTNLGVSMFDGTSWNNYTLASGLLQDDVLSIAIDTNNHVWCGTAGALSYFDGISWTNYTINEGLPGNTVSSVIIDSTNTLYIGTDGGLSVYNGSNFTNYTTNEGLVNNFIQCLKFDNNGNLYIGTQGGLSIFDGSSFTNYTISNGLSGDIINSIDFDAYNNVYIATRYNGISIYDGSNWSYIDTSNGLLSNQIIRLHVLENNKFLFGYSYYWKSYIYDNGNISLFYESFPHSYIVDIDYDSNGNMWIGSGFGISKMKDSILENYYTVDDEIVGYMLTDIEVAKNDDIWIGQHLGMNVYNNQSWINYPPFYGYQGEDIGAILCNHSSNIWVAVDYYGVSVYDGISWTFDDNNLTFSQYQYSDICEDFNYNIWLSSNHGVFKFDGASWINYTTADGLISDQVQCVTVDVNNNIWIGTTAGISVFDGITWTNYTTLDGLSSNLIHDIAIDMNNIKWIATFDTGLCKYDDTNWSNISFNDGLLNNEIYSVCINEKGEKWLGCRGGVSVYKDGGTGPVSIGDKTIRGNVFLDENLNGIKDNNEQGLPGKQVVIQPSGNITVTNNNGDYYFSVDTGLYSVLCQQYLYWTLTSDSISYQVNVIDSIDVYSGYDFGIIPTQNVEDLAINITAIQPRIGFETMYWLNYSNLGSVTQNGTIEYKYDSLLTFISSQPNPNNINGNILTFNYDTLVSQESRCINMVYQVPGIQSINDTLEGFASVTPLISDTNQINNYDTIAQIITGAIDPNDKLVDPAGVGAEGYILHGTEIEYTIRFQNTGTDTAFLVQILDTIDFNLDMSTFVIIASSHPMTYSINGLNKVIFTFNNICLPDSNTNFLESNGFVKYRIKPYNNLPDNIVVSNKAYIYFDFNPAIITNEVSNTFVSIIPTFKKIIIDNIINDINIYPNPTTGKINVKAEEIENIKVLNLQGKEIYNGKENEIDLNKEPKGIYIIKVRTDKGVAVRKVVLE